MTFRRPAFVASLALALACSGGSGPPPEEPPPGGSTCGDGVASGGEACDDGNLVNLDGCDASCRFEEILRARSITYEWAPTAECARNALGEAAVSTTTRTMLQQGLSNGVSQGTVNFMLWLRGLDDLAGGTDPSLDVGLLTGDVHPLYGSFVNSATLDGWFTAASDSVDAARLPLLQLPGALEGGALAAGPGDAILHLPMMGEISALELFDATLALDVAGVAAIGTSMDGLPPGHTADEHQTPGLQTVSAADGQLCGAVSARSLASSTLSMSLGFCGYSASSVSVLDLLVSGCTTVGAAATQPDVVDPGASTLGAGPPYQLVAGPGKIVEDCTDRLGTSVGLDACLDALGYSMVLRLALDRVIVKPACGDGVIMAPEACDDRNSSFGDGCYECAVETGWECMGSPSSCAPICGDGIVVGTEGCDDGNSVDTDSCRNTCTAPRCGDVIVDPGEECDDGNDVGGDGCQPTCHLPTCGDYWVDPDESCDDGNDLGEDGCSASCTVEEGWACEPTDFQSFCRPVCGDRLVRGGEFCDDGNAVTEAACSYGTPSCVACSGDCLYELDLTGPYCGNDFIEDQEQCDDGNTVTETACPYGVRSCESCSATCSQLFLSGDYCSDGFINGPEACDDGNEVTETSCPYGIPSCDGCSADCLSAPTLTGDYCSDGFINGPEVCDDGNEEACGTCDATCGTSTPAAQATGTITALDSARLVDGETFTIYDGVNPPTTFEFDYGYGFTPGNVRVLLSTGMSASDVAWEIFFAVNNVTDTLRVSVWDAVGANVMLRNDLATVLGNLPLMETVTDGGFFVSGMSGGAAGDCGAGVTCREDAVCAPGLICFGGICQ